MTPSFEVFSRHVVSAGWGSAPVRPPPPILPNLDASRPHSWVRYSSHSHMCYANRASTQVPRLPGHPLWITRVYRLRLPVPCHAHPPHLPTTPTRNAHDHTTTGTGPMTSLVRCGTLQPGLGGLAAPLALPPSTWYRLSRQGVLASRLAEKLEDSYSTWLPFVFPCRKY